MNEVFGDQPSWVRAFVKSPIRLSTSARRKYEEEFYKKLKQADSKAADLLPGFVEKCEDLGFYTKFGDSSLMLHWDSEDSVDFNFATFLKDGRLKTNYFADRTRQIGQLEIGEKYLEDLASLLDGGNVIKKGKE